MITIKTKSCHHHARARAHLSIFLLLLLILILILIPPRLPAAVDPTPATGVRVANTGVLLTPTNFFSTNIVALSNALRASLTGTGVTNNTTAPRIRKVSQIVSRKNREALSNELVIAEFLFTGGPASNTLAYNPRNVGPGRSMFLRDLVQCVEADPLFFRADQLRGYARAFTNNISGIDLFCSEQLQSGANGYGPYFDSQFDFVWLVYEHYRKTRATTLFLEMQPRIEAAITRVKSSPFMSNSIPFVSLDTMGGWGFNDTILYETNYNVGLDFVCSMFWIRTCRQLSEMYFASGQFAKGSNALVDLSRTSASVMTNFWSEDRGLFRSYQLSITNHSIVGSALAVVYDAVPKAVQQRIIAELISGLPGGEDFAAGNGFFKNGGIRFWPANEQPGITNSQNGGYWPGFAAYVARAIQYDAPDVAEHIVSYHITNTVRLVQAGVTNHIRVGQLEWFGAEFSDNPTAFGYNNNIQSQAGGVIEPVSTEVFSGFVEGEGSFSKISSMTNGPLEIVSETRIGGGRFRRTASPGVILDSGETTTPPIRFYFGDWLNFAIGSDSFTMWFVYNLNETNGVVLGRWQGDGLLLSLGGFLAAGGVFTGDGTGLTNLNAANISSGKLTAYGNMDFNGFSATNLNNLELGGTLSAATLSVGTLTLTNYGGLLTNGTTLNVVLAGSSNHVLGALTIIGTNRSAMFLAGGASPGLDAIKATGSIRASGNITGLGIYSDVFGESGGGKIIEKATGVYKFGEGQADFRFVNTGLVQFGGNNPAVPALDQVNGDLVLTDGTGALTTNRFRTPGLMVGSANGVTVNGIRHGISGAMELGSVTVTDAGCTANTRYFFSAHTLGTISIPGGYYASTRTASTSFVITSSEPTETSTIDWIAIEP